MRYRAALAAVACLALAALGVVGPTQATWQHSQVADAGTVGAVQLPGPASTTCTNIPNLLGARAQLSWPAATVPPGVSSIRYRVTSQFEGHSAVRQDFTTNTQMTFTTTLLEGLLSLSIGRIDRLNVTVETLYKYPSSEWVSVTSAHRVLLRNGGLLGVAASVTCEVEGTRAG